MSGRFITVEGIEGVGKTTNIEFIEQLLRDAGKDVVMTREPGGTSLGEDVRELLLGHKHDGMSRDAELLLMFAARAEHLDKVIQPALDNGKWVLCDRFTDATYAYQGGGRGFDTAPIATLETLVQDSLRPDLTLLLDVSVEIGLDRAGKRSEPDRFEKEKHDFFERVRQTYLERAHADASRMKIIDASQPLDAVQVQIKETIMAFLQNE
ncbi:MAG: dTMP kinase [Sulfuriflexus sp.]|nr:dTMP kinase [Sulfuriflexus sp.]